MARIIKIKDGQRFAKGNLTKHRLTDQTVVLIIKRYLEIAGIDNQNFSGHSLRSNCKQTRFMAMTGQSNGKKIHLFKNNALNKIKI